VTTWQKPDLRTDQVGRTELAPLLGGGAGGADRVTSVAGWEQRRADIAATIRRILGQPTGLTPPACEVRELGSEDLGGYTRRRVNIRSEPDDWIPAYLLVPKRLAAPRVPAMICLHQTVAQGKAEPCGIQGDAELAFAVELVQRGYVCLAPDVIGFGDRIAPGKPPYDNSLAFYRKHPGWSFLGKMIWDVSRLVDYLESLACVDAGRIGCMGHSHGAYGTLFAAAFEPRLAAAVASCGFTTFRADPQPERWSHLTALLPQLGFYLPDVASIPFDWQHVLALVAPRNLFVWYTTQDTVFPRTENLAELLRDVQRVYRLYGAEPALAWQSADGPHQFPRARREAAYRWLDEHLTPTTGPPRASEGPSLPSASRRNQTRSASAAAAEASTAGAAAFPSPAKTASVFFPGALVARARANAREHSWAANIRDALVAAARPWKQMSDDALWDLMFGNTIRRAWQVWSDGHCPACRQPVPMYEWQADALRQPWKMRCPRCGELFPKNDFARFYRSGLNAQGVFEPHRADRSLLFNAEHPDPADPLHRFGVDDGEGYVEGPQRWRFIGAYLIYGQWKQAIVDGIRNLAAAYVATGEPLYAHKAGVLLDRVADLYPTFDFGQEGVMYEGPPRAGYISTWHDACVEVRELALAYDAVFEALAGDAALVEFLAAKAAQHRLANAKSGFADVQRNIEERIFRDTLAHRAKIESNYPATDATLLTLQTVLGWPGNRAAVLAALEAILTQATAVDGVTGEKGIAGYSVIGPQGLAELLGRYARAEPEFLREILRRHPRLHATYRFHLDTLCLDRYYPRTGDTGVFARQTGGYVGVPFTQNPGIQPSAYSFLWALYEATGDVDFVRLLYAANGASAQGLPYDLFAPDPAAFQAQVTRVIAERGADIRLPSVNKTEWCLAILRSGTGAHARAAWLDYDSGGGHGHADALTLGLFAKKLDLLPDFGYPPVQYGGWTAPRARWYSQTTAHNTVAVDGQDTRPGRGRCTLWFDGVAVHAVRVAAPELIAGQQYERTVVLVDISESDSYLVDVFRVVGGTEHTRFLHGHFGSVTASGLSLAPVAEPRGDPHRRACRRDPRPPPIWTAEWQIEDRLQYLPPGSTVRLRLTDLTPQATVTLAETWVAAGGFSATADAWVPTVLVSRQTLQPPLASTFVGVLEPLEGDSHLADVRRLALEDDAGAACPEEVVGLEVRLADGRRDLLLAANVRAGDAAGAPPRAPPVLVQKETGARFAGELCLIRFGAEHQPERVVFCHGQSLCLGTLQVQSKRADASFELDLRNRAAPVVAGAVDAVGRLEVGGVRLWPR